MNSWLMVVLITIVIQFHTGFPQERVAGAAALGGLEMHHGQQHSQIVLLAPHQVCAANLVINFLCY